MILTEPLQDHSHHQNLYTELLSFTWTITVFFQIQVSYLQCYIASNIEWSCVPTEHPQKRWANQQNLQCLRIRYPLTPLLCLMGWPVLSVELTTLFHFLKWIMIIFYQCHFLFWGPSALAHSWSLRWNHSFPGKPSLSYRTRPSLQFLFSYHNASLYPGNCYLFDFFFVWGVT